MEGRGEEKPASAAGSKRRVEILSRGITPRRYVANRELPRTYTTARRVAFIALSCCGERERINIARLIDARAATNHPEAGVVPALLPTIIFMGRLVGKYGERAFEFLPFAPSYFVLHIFRMH